VFHVKHHPRALLTGLDAGRVDQLERYAGLLIDRGAPLGFIAKGDAHRVMERHVLDSLRALPRIRPSDRRLADLGSGAGLPGIPVAIAAPDRTITLIESRQRRAAFLEWVVAQLRIENVHVLRSRADDVLDTFDACMARAFADAATTWRVARRLLAPAGRLLYFAGASWPAGAAPLQALGVSIEECDAPRPGPSGPVVIMREVSEVVERSTDGEHAAGPRRTDGG